MKPETSWKRAYREYLNGHNGYGDPLSVRGIPRQA